MRIAFFGGSFDPPHNGHLGIARAAQRALDLDTVLFAPVGRQPLKPAGPAAGFEERVAMTRIAIAHNPHFELSLIDAPVIGSLAPNYTADTLQHLRQSLPPDTELYLLLGSDSFTALSKWHRAAEIPFLANLIVASRPLDEPAMPSPPALKNQIQNDPALNYEIQSNEAASCKALDEKTIAASLPSGVVMHRVPGQASRYILTNLSGAQASLTLLPDLHFEISATQLRHALQDHASAAAEALPAAVLAYIREHHLYA
jgi:nicotinate-nucleotide adenylyltransferase